MPTGALQAQKANTLMDLGYKNFIVSTPQTLDFIMAEFLAL